MAVARLRQQDQLDHATSIGYQAVRIWLLTMKNKKMPDFSSVTGSRPRAVAHAPEHAAAVLELLAARMGGKVRPRTKETQT